MDTSTSKPRKKSIFLSVNRAWRSILPPIAQKNINSNPVEDSRSPQPFIAGSPNIPMPTFGDLSGSSGRGQRHRSVVLEENSDPQIRTPRSESPGIILTPPNINSSKKFAKKLSKMNSVFYMNKSNDMALNEPDDIPSILNEYKYRRMDTTNFGNDQDKTSKSDPKKYSFSSTPNKRSGSSPLATFDISQGAIPRSPLSNGRRDQKPSLRSLNSQYWVPSSYGAKILGAISPRTMNSSNSECSDDDTIIMTERQTLVRKRFRKVLYASYFMGLMQTFRNRVQMYGALRPIEYFEQFEGQKVVQERKFSFLPILPTSTFSLVWMFIVIFLLALCAVLTPLYVAFADDGDRFFDIMNNVFNVGFGIDILMNFLTAYYNSRGKLVTKFSKISSNYLKLWFWIDIAAILPFETITNAITVDVSNVKRANQLLRLLRFPRLYRMLRILRLVKMMSLFASNHRLNKVIKNLNMNITFFRVMKILINIFFLNHFMGCLWYFVARMDDFSPDTWVSRNNLVDASKSEQYVASIYWAFQTFVSLGYGDIVAHTDVEFIISICWILVNVGFYSFSLSNLTTTLSNIDVRSRYLVQKNASFQYFARKTRLPEFLRQRVQRSFEISHKENICNWGDPNGHLRGLPASLKTSLLLYSYYGLIKNIKLLQVDPNFTASLLLHFKLCQFQEGDMIYREDDPAFEVYFIVKGSIKFVTGSSQNIFSLAEGTYFGEIEVLESTKRRCFCQVLNSVTLLVCSKADFVRVLHEFPAIESQVEKIAELRKNKVDAKVHKMNQTESEIFDDEQNAAQKKPRLMKSTEYLNRLLLNKADQPKKKGYAFTGIQEKDNEVRRNTLFNKIGDFLGLSSGIAVEKGPTKYQVNPPTLEEQLVAYKKKQEEFKRSKTHKDNFLSKNNKVLNNSGLDSETSKISSSHPSMNTINTVKRLISDTSENLKSLLSRGGRGSKDTELSILESKENANETLPKFAITSPINTIPTETNQLITEDNDKSFDPPTPFRIDSSDTSRNVTRIVSYGNSMPFFSDLSAGLKGRSFKGLDRINELPPVLGLRTSRTDDISENNSPQLLSTRRNSSRRDLLASKRKPAAD